MRAILVGLALALSAAMMLSRAAAAETYIIDSGVWAHYQQYLKAIRNGLRPGAFVISKDGYSSFYYWCPDTRCMTQVSYSQDALNYCKREYKAECVVFAVRDQIKVKYEIAGLPPSTPSPPAAASSEPNPPAVVPSNPPELVPAPTTVSVTPDPQPDIAAVAPSTPSLPVLAPPPVTPVSVSPEVQSDIDAYLRKAKSGGRVWALALAKDGSRVGEANCPISSGYTSGACYPVLGTPQELANREAIKRCGGTARCVLLYVGEQKQGNVEIVAR